VDSMLRRLRLNAFSLANKFPENRPRPKVAVLERAYRKPPSYGFCPTPEANWANIEIAEMLKLEALLRYFHVTCKDTVAKAFVNGIQGRAFLANVDVAVTDALITSKPQLRTNAIM
jgi:hypothetical protein